MKRRLAGVRSRIGLRRTNNPPPAVPAGHFYSPIPAREDIDRALDQSRITDLPGIEVDVEGQRRLLRELSNHYGEVVAGTIDGGRRFEWGNVWFTHADAVIMAMMLRSLRPRRIVEVGCGHSTALLLDELESGGHDGVDVTLIEPHPEALRSIVEESDLEGRLLESLVQDVSLEIFTDLGRGDILAIDSSHIVKAGSDCYFLLTEVFPRLAPGVFIHLHDIFWPFEYPRIWLDKGRAFNEAYVLRALLQGSSWLRIRLFTDLMLTMEEDYLRQAMPRMLDASIPVGGLWLERC